MGLATGVSSIGEVTDCALKSGGVFLTGLHIQAGLLAVSCGQVESLAGYYIHL